METEVSGRIGATPYERSATRTANGNAYRSRTWDTQVGTIEFKIPKISSGAYFASLLEPRRRAERALHAVVVEAYVRACLPARSMIWSKAPGSTGFPRATSPGSTRRWTRT